MHTWDDADLLAAYATQRSEVAFATLVERHLPLVYSSALRQVHNPHLAEEISQAVFIILACKADQLKKETVLVGWLCRTAHFTALNALKAEQRRQYHETEAHMETLTSESEPDVWPQIAPLLDAALARLDNTDRNAIVLRFYQQKSLAEVGQALGVNPDAAQKRVTRAVDKLRQYLVKRGVMLTATVIASAVAANSVQAAPAGLAATVTAAAAKGAAVSGSTLTIIKGALKIMAWTKMKTSLAMGVSVLFAVGMVTVAVQEYPEYRTCSWEIPTVYDPVNHNFGFDFSPPQVQIKRSIYPAFKVSMNDPGVASIQMPDGTFEQTNYDHWTGIGLGMTLAEILRTAYGAQKYEVVYLTKIRAKPLYDYISCLPHGTAQPLQELIKKKSGIVGKWEMRETDVLLLQLSDLHGQTFQPAESLMQSMNITNASPLDRLHGFSRGNVYCDQTIASLVKQLWLADTFKLPVIDETGMTNRFDCVFKYPGWYNNGRPDPERDAWEEALRNQFGLKLIPARRPVKMLVVEKVH